MKKKNFIISTVALASIGLIAISSQAMASPSVAAVGEFDDAISEWTKATRPSSQYALEYDQTSFLLGQGTMKDCLESSGYGDTFVADSSPLPPLIARSGGMAPVPEMSVWNPSLGIAEMTFFNAAAQAVSSTRSAETKILSENARSRYSAEEWKVRSKVFNECASEASEAAFSLQYVERNSGLEIIERELSVSGKAAIALKKRNYSQCLERSFGVKLNGLSQVYIYLDNEMSAKFDADLKQDYLTGKRDAFDRARDWEESQLSLEWECRKPYRDMLVKHLGPGVHQYLTQERVRTFAAQKDSAAEEMSERLEQLQGKYSDIALPETIEVPGA